MTQVGYPSGVVDMHGNVVADMPCRRCSYNVRGLNQYGRCPECGTPVGVSLHGDLLRYSDPGWVRTVSRGINLILWGILIGIVAGIMGGILSIAFPVIIGHIVALLGGLVSVWGAWLLTAPDPSRVGAEGKDSTARQIVRFALLVGLLAQAIQLFQDVAKVTREQEVVIAVIVGIIGLIGVVGEFARLYYFEQLADRVPDPALAQRARTIRWGFGISLAVVVVMGVLVLVMAAGNPSAARQSGAAGGFMALGCIAAIAGIGMLVFGIMYLIMLFRFNRVLGEQAEFAERTWFAGLAAAEAANQQQSSMPPPLQQ